MKILRLGRHGVLVVLSGAMGLAFADQNKEMKVDSAGVLRWTEDGSEAALFGVNYYVPFSTDYQAIRAKGGDHVREMARDVAHFRRLGLSSVRVHCFDRQMSMHEGGFVATYHVELLDRLIALCASNGIRTVLTPIAWYDYHVGESGRDGFSNCWSMHQLTGDRRSWPAQCRYLKEFGEHMNPHTGRRYAEDPAIAAFELINEPLYPPGLPDAAVTEYVNTLAAALRSSGTRKPIFYNAWNGRNAAVGRSTADGVSGVCYATGLALGSSLLGAQLWRATESSLNPNEDIARKAKMIYEFDTADMPDAYMYPALARLFRHEGVQIANQFQYDPLCLADVNMGWTTHHLNLVYTPAKALSFAVAAEAFRRLPRGCPYQVPKVEMNFPPFRVDATANLSQFVTETDYIYTNDPKDDPVAPEKLTRIWGVGRSRVAGASGNGCYFLDRAMPGVWRLQLYPDVLTIADPYSGKPGLKHAICPGTRTMTVRLPDLGDDYRVRRTEDDQVVGRACEGRVELAAGDYVLENVADYGTAAHAALASLKTPPFFAPPPTQSAYATVRVPRQGRAGTALPLDFKGCNLRDVTAHVSITAHDAAGREVKLSGVEQTFDVRLCQEPSEWNFFDAEVAVRAPFYPIGPEFRKYRADADPVCGTAFGYSAAANAFTGTVTHAGGRIPCDVEAFRRLFPKTRSCKAVVLRVRAADDFTDRFELVFMQLNGETWGCHVPLKRTWQTVRIPVGQLAPVWETKRGQSSGADPLRTYAFSMTIGKWLFGQTLDKPHGFEISSIGYEF